MFRSSWRSPGEKNRYSEAGNETGTNAGTRYGKGEAADDKFPFIPDT